MIDNEAFQHLQRNLSHPIIGEMGFNDIPYLIELLELINPRSILELGFNRGMSSIIFLEYSNAFVHSIDIRSIEDVKNSILLIEKQYPNRFKYTSLNHENLNENKYINLYKNQYDTIFIDGDHSYKGVKRDIINSLNFNPKYIVLDDYNHTSHSQDIKNAIVESSVLKIISEYNTGCGLVVTENLNYKNYHE